MVMHPACTSQAQGFRPRPPTSSTNTEEADAIILNRVDELSEAQVAETAALVAKAHPGTPLLRASAKTGQGFDALIELLDQDGRFGRKILDIDYDVYAEGEAEMGWLNANVQLEADQPFAIDDLLLDVVGRLRTSLNSTT